MISFLGRVVEPPSCDDMPPPEARHVLYGCGLYIDLVIKSVKQLTLRLLNCPIDLALRLSSVSAFLRAWVG